MGTNYYLHLSPPCGACGRRDKPLHIGKSSWGWCFYLHVIPEEDVNSLDDWRRLWSAPQAEIVDESGNSVSPDVMERIITQRRAPSDLRRCHIDDHCIGHGDGPWDYIAGEFS